MASESQRPCATPTAFRRALTDKLRAISAPAGPWPLPDLQRQFAYDRLLARLYLLDSGWIVKGSTALLARRIAVRHTIDIDVYRATKRDEAERDLRAALGLDAGDWFEFTASRGIPIADGVNGVRIPVDARIGATTWAKFHVDVVADGVRMTGTPDDVPALTEVGIPGLAQPGYRAYPLVDHIADKTFAIIEPQGPAGHPSTRFKDLVDLVVLTTHARPTAEAQCKALDSESARRGIALPRTFDVPDAALWQPGYGAEARRTRLSKARSLPEALVWVRQFLDPLYGGTADGIWNPDKGLWVHVA